MVELPKNEEPLLRVVTRPNDANPTGDIFGGWLMSQIDIAGSIAAAVRAKGPVVTVAVQQLQFIQPLFVHDLVSFYGQVVKVGQTSLTVELQAYAERLNQGQNTIVKVSDATLVYVAVAKPGQKRLVPTG